MTLNDNAGDKSAGLGWLLGWRRTSAGLRLETLVQRDGQAVKALAPASLLLEQQRSFEPSLKFFAGLRTQSVRIRVDDLSVLSRVIRTNGVLGRRLPHAMRTRHAIYVAGHEGVVAYLPASLLLRELWLWSVPAMHALFLPNALDLYLCAADDAEGLVVQAAGQLARAGSSDSGLRRLSWLAQCPDARASWSSVLTYAHAGAINLKLPRASMQAWGWGVALRHGVLVAELSSVALDFELPAEDVRVHLGSRRLVCPPAPARRTGLVSY